ncbi:MAG: iron-sulfur cluster assembly accessory protein [bacterium]
MLIITEKAKQKITEMLNQEGQGYYLRLYAIPSGCCGIDFGMEITNETDSSDNFIDLEKFKVVVDDFSYPFIENLEIDVVERENKVYFVVSQQKQNGCGCSCQSCECQSSTCSCGSNCNCH